MVTQKDKVKLVLQKVRAADIEGYLYLRVKVPHQKRYKFKALGQKVPEKFWDAENELVKKGFTGYQKINDAAATKKAEVNRSLEIARLQDTTITAGSIRNILDGSIRNAGSFMQFYQEHINYISTRNKKGEAKVSDAYIDIWNVEFRTLKAYAGEKLRFEDITAQWLEKYESHLAVGVNQQTTLSKKMKRLKQIIYKAMSMEKIAPSAIAGYRFPKYTAPERQYLTLQETENIWDLVETGAIDGTLLSVACFFLLECYAGLRYSDWGKFKIEKLMKEENLRVRTTKTNSPVYLPLKYFPRLKRVLDYIKANEIEPVKTEKTANMYLKVLANAAKIKLNLTTHVGRHTCGTLLGELGYSSKDIAEVLGISEAVAKVYIKQTRKGLLTTLERYGGL